MFQKQTGDYHYGASKEEDDAFETVVGPSVQVEGDFASEGNIVVKGTVCGSVKTSRMLTVEDGAKILADVRAQNAIVSGQIKGNLKVTDRLELTETAQVLGDVSCSVLVMAPGALLQGKLAMSGISIEDAKSVRKRSTRIRKTTSKIQDELEEDHEEEISE